MTFDDIRKQMNGIYNEIRKMNGESLNLFRESHDLLEDTIPLGTDLKLAQNLVYYKYYAKLCALNAINLPQKLFKRLKKAESKYKESLQFKVEELTTKRGGRQALIKRLLALGKDRNEIKIAVSEAYPDVPLANVGCHIAAVITYLKKKEARNVK